METILKQHNQVELPWEVLRKLELLPGVRFDVEINSHTGVITLVPLTGKLIRVNHRRENPHSRISPGSHK